MIIILYWFCYDYLTVQCAIVTFKDRESVAKALKRDGASIQGTVVSIRPSKYLLFALE